MTTIERRARGSRRQRLEITLLVTPALVLYASFVLVPIGMAFYYSGFKWNGLGPLDDFVGLETTSQP